MKTRGLGTVARSDSKTAIPGISLEKARTGKGVLLGHYNIRAYCMGKTKRWSTKKHGWRKSFRLARNWRDEQVAIYVVAMAMKRASEILSKID